MNVHLLDGTYELFRHFFGAPPRQMSDGREVGAIRGVVESVISLLNDPEVTHLAVAFDHVIESFRNDMYAGYKTGEGMDPVLWSQAHPLEEALRAMGVVVWPMIEFEADDALAAGAMIAGADPRVDRVFILTPDKDLGQCVEGTRVVQFDRRARKLIDHNGVVEKFGVPPASIPDYLALVGDTADGYPGIPGWGAKSTAAVLAVYGSLENIPRNPGQWEVPGLRGAQKLCASLNERLADAVLFRAIATVARESITLEHGIDELEWRGPRADFEAVALEMFDGASIVKKVEALTAKKIRS
jgi:5'-3' exonuclease